MITGKEAGWSDIKKWLMDIAKYSITFVFGAVATILFLEGREDERARVQKIWDVQLNLGVSEMLEFDKSARLYSAAALDAYVELYENDPKKPGETPIMRRYENETYDKYQIALSRIKRRCEGLEKCTQIIAQIENTNVQRHKIYDDIVDDRLVPHDPWKFRDQFDEYGKIFKSEVSTLVSFLESNLLSKN